MRKENTTIRTKFISEAGSFLRNADYFAFVELEDCACYCIADGIDADSEKESARLAVTAAIAAFQEKPKCSKTCLKSCIQAAHRELLRESGRLRLEASILILVTDYQNYRTVHAGNAREYLFRNGKQAEQSKDMSVSRTMAENGEIPKDKVEEHEERHNLYCYLGQPETFRPQYSRKKKLKDGDIFLLCTRGIWQHIGTAEFMDAMEEAKEPEEVCTAMEEVILSRRLERLDNYTIACIFIDKIYRDNGRRKKLIKWVLIVIVLLIFAAGIAGLIWYLLYRSNQKKIIQMLEQKQSGIEFFQEESYNRAAKEFTEALGIEEKISYSTLLNKDTKRVREEVGELEVYDKMLQLLLDAEERMEKQDYSGAVGKYENAKKLLKEIGGIDEERINQIQSRSNQAIIYMDILELLETGEEEEFLENLVKALETYQEAYELASENNAAEYKKEAAERIKEIKAEISNQDEQKQKEEAEKQKENLLMEAERQMNQGDIAYDAGEYEEAVKAYQNAVEYYTQAEATDKLPVVESRMVLAENKNTILAKQRIQAEEYIRKAEEKLELGDGQAALVLYGLALEIYQEYGMNSEAEYMKQKIQEIEEENKKESEISETTDSSNTEESEISEMADSSSAEESETFETVDSSSAEENEVSETAVNSTQEMTGSEAR